MLFSLHHNNAANLSALIPHALTPKIILQCVDIVVVLEFPLFSANELDHTKGCGKFENVAMKSSSSIVIVSLRILRNGKIKMP